MNYLKNQINDFQNELKTITSWNFYCILLTIESIYRCNKNLISFAAEQRNTPDLKDIVFMGTNQEGFIDYNLDSSYLSLLNQNFIINNYKDYDCERQEGDVINLLNSFNKLKSREERFSIYEKYCHSVVPGYTVIIDKWKNFQSEDVIEETLKKNNHSLNLSEYLMKKRIDFPETLQSAIDFNSTIFLTGDDLFNQKTFLLQNKIESFKFLLNLFEYISFVRKNSFVDKLEFNINKAYDTGVACEISRLKLYFNDEQPHYKEELILPKGKFDLYFDLDNHKTFSVDKNSTINDFESLIRSLNLFDDEIIKIKSIFEKEIIMSNLNSVSEVEKTITKRL